MTPDDLVIRGDQLEYMLADGTKATVPLGSPEGFRVLSELWLRSGWDTKYVYSFSWLGRPIIQLPEDLLRLQEVIVQVNPTVVIETGVAHGGGLVFYASILHAIGGGRVIGVDIHIRPENRLALEQHPLAPLLTLVEGSSIDVRVLDEVRAQLSVDDNVLVVLDSNHTHEHVLEELRSYGPLVTPGSYIVACDGIMQNLAGAPRSDPSWAHSNPQTAVRAFLEETDNFKLVEPPFTFNEGEIQDRVTYWPHAFLMRT